MGAFCEKIDDSFRWTAVLAEAILMLADLMQISIQTAFAKMEPVYDDKKYSGTLFADTV